MECHNTILLILILSQDFQPSTTDCSYNILNDADNIIIGLSPTINYTFNINIIRYESSININSTVTMTIIIYKLIL